MCPALRGTRTATRTETGRLPHAGFNKVPAGLGADPPAAPLHKLPFRGGVRRTEKLPRPLRPHPQRSLPDLEHRKLFWFLGHR